MAAWKEGAADMGMSPNHSLSSGPLRAGCGMLTNIVVATAYRLHCIHFALVDADRYRSDHPRLKKTLFPFVFFYRLRVVLRRASR